MLSLAVYLALATALVGLSFVVFRKFVRQDYLRVGRLSTRSALLETAVFVLWGVFTWIDLPAEWPSPWIDPLLRSLALVLILIGLLGLFVTMASFGLRRALGQQVDELKQLGLYARSRNPQILLCGLAVVGYSLLWPSWHTAGWVLLYAILAHLMVVTEEEHLRAKFGADYDDYCRRVPRYLSFGRRSDVAVL